MGETLSVEIPREIKQVIKRIRPDEWKFPEPPPKRPRIFEDDGAKAPNLDKIVT
jgi:hypothetical protein